MSEKFAISQQEALEKRNDRSEVPVLFLSSEEIGWEGLVARAYHEPRELEGWIAASEPDISLIMFAGGSMLMGQRHLNGDWREMRMGQGDLVLRPGGGAPYEMRWKGLSDEPMQTLHVQLDKDLVLRTAHELAGCDPTRLAVAGRAGFQDPLLTQVGFALWRELEQGAPAGKLYAQTTAQMLAVHLLRHYTQPVIDIKEYAQRLTHQQIKRVTDFVLAHLSQELSLETLAQQIGFSAYYFARLFRETTGETPHQFVLRQRIKRAQHLLKETHESLAQVALESGFANQSHLTQVFRRHLGLTPRAYRQDY
jgi:AraC family transcriptional regulator